ncbi:SEC14 cytosolic factor [Momordica charantia]|uniref:SEC14 cytosolic factor n=1 Tax=Momordica charantia TaxID=3673 RepID=A0A6J1CYF1_MOMCH|nr:SEC14 cytosolic factor [Momordica charantia]XP_022146820.1 SEC14 cytosolic factor [Momordica charantia]
MENTQQIVVAQMRRLVEEHGVPTEKYGEPTMMRFLIARSMDPEKAAKMFVQWQKWRDTTVPNGRIDESEIKDELEARKIYLQGLSKNGHSVMIVKGNKHYPAKDQVQFKKYVAYSLDKIIASAFQGREIGNEKLIAILDLQQLSYKNIDPRGLITGFQSLQAYYPERLAKCYFLHMPRFFVSVWRMVSRFLEKATLEKIVIVSCEEERRSIIEEIGEEVLPVEYGGRAKLIALQDVVLPHLDA